MYQERCWAKKYGNIFTAVEEVRPAGIKSTNIPFVSIRKNYFHYCNCLRITLLRKYCLTDCEHGGPQSLSDLSKYIKPAVGGARIQTQVFWPKTFPQYCVRMCRKGFSLASPHNRWALSICMQNSTWVPYFLLPCSQKTVCVGLYHKLSWA